MSNPFEEIAERLQRIEDLLSDIKRQQAEPVVTKNEAPRVMTIEQLCEHFGVKKGTIYKLTSERAIPHSKRGKKLFFDRVKIDAWLLERQMLTNADVEQKVEKFLRGD